MKYVLFIVIATATLVGCKSNGNSRHVERANNSAAVIGAQAQSIEQLAEETKAHTNTTGVQLLSSIQAAAQIIQSRVGDIHIALTAVNQEIAKWRDKYERLNNSWAVKIGRFVLWTFWIIIVGGVVALILSLSSPGGWAFRIGKELIRFLPFMNWVSWTRDSVQNRTKKK